MLVDAVGSNAFRKALSAGRPLIGIWSMLNSANATEGLSHAGFDWILIDGEHSPVTLPDAIAHLRAAQAAPIVPIVRLACNDEILLKQYLDAGATTIMLPYVETRADAEAAVRAMRYPPLGRRGVAAMHRASRYGRRPDYLESANAGLYLIVQIETLNAIENLEDIAGVDGVDAVFFGPGDLSASMGLLGQPEHPKVTELITASARKARELGKAVGVLSPNDGLSERHLSEGFDFVSVANDCAILFRNGDRIALHFRQLASSFQGKSESVQQQA